MRLDIFVKENFGIQSRSKATELVLEGKVKVDDRVITKPAHTIVKGMKISVDEDVFFVSRAAYKLKYFLEAVPELHLAGLEALDIGSSTGGFTQVLLNRGVNSVTCVDVGSKQLHPRIRTDYRVNLFEKTDIRDFKSLVRFDIVTCDVSFIGLEKIIKDIDRLASKHIIMLFKPQFEVGPNGKDGRGVVKDVAIATGAKKEFMKQCAEIGWKFVINKPSELKGRFGNAEEFLYYVKQ